jgi:hypothetical protein
VGEAIGVGDDVVPEPGAIFFGLAVLLVFTYL